MLELNRIYNEDCIGNKESGVGMWRIPDKSVDMILCDLPYASGNTACDWDVSIPLNLLWEQYERIIKDNGAIVLTAVQPFTSMLIMSNLKQFRHMWVWNKKAAANVLQAKNHPLKIHEDILVFSKKKVNYYPQMTEGKMRKKDGGKNALVNVMSNFEDKEKGRANNLYYPKSIIEFSNANQRGKIHPTQKPLSLFQYLILTYTRELNELGDKSIILDNCMGSGTTAVACINTQRNYIGFELDKEYHRLAEERIHSSIL